MPTSPIDIETRAAGAPIDNPDHDDFQRVQFAERIADTLIKRRSPASIVVGLYGKWGEGKSSVLHFIRRSLSASDTVVVLHFNPWRFVDETQLLVNFFGELAKTIGQNLLTRKQRAVKGLSSYVAPLVPSVSLGPVSADISKGFEALLKMAQPEVDAQRERIESLIVESGKRVVVIIDDIDRLEKSQIQAVFRLVKLTADFKQTSYLLSFDDEMVARAIGEVFASGGDDVTGSRTLLAGQNFLEKIIQVPLRLPHALPDDLLQFCWNRLSEVLTETETVIPSSEQETLIEALRSAVLPRLTTPRLAVRFANAVQFGLPLLRGEVDTVDQILVEAMHIFYPHIHQYVATHAHDFQGGADTKNTFGRGGDDGRKERIERVLDYYQADDRQGALALLRILFPAVNRLFNTSLPWVGPAEGNESIMEEALIRRKAVAASSHLPRYFTYSVVRGDVSDIEFQSFLHNTSEDQSIVAAGLVARLGVTRFLQKMQYQLSSLTSEQATHLWDVIADVSYSFNGVMYGPSVELVISHERQAAKLLLALLHRLEGPQVRRELIERLISSTGTFYFAKELQYRLRNQRGIETPGGYVEGVVTPTLDGLFTQQEWKELMDEALPELLLTRALMEAGDEPIYKKYPLYAFNLLFHVWPQSSHHPDVVTYIRERLAQFPGDIHDILLICSSTITMNGRVYLASVTTQHVRVITDLFGSYLYDIVRQMLSEPANSYPGDERDYEEPTQDDRIRQFIYLSERALGMHMTSETTEV